MTTDDLTDANESAIGKMMMDQYVANKDKPPPPEPTREEQFRRRNHPTEEEKIIDDHFLKLGFRVGSHE